MARTSKFSEPIVLASASPRRLELLSDFAQDVTVIPSDVDESKVKATCARTLVKRLSRLKALSVASSADVEGKIVIGADTVVYRGKIYGKPSNRADAIRMLTELGGKKHYVFTGVTVVDAGRIRTFAVRSTVRFKKLTAEQIERYVDEHNPYDKAGAYAIQENVVVESYAGSYTNIVGLPMEKLAKVLKSEEV